jgi:hypothetical protein
MITYQLIKSTVESVSKIEDLSIRNRIRYVADCRIVYFGLCNFYLKGAYHGTNCSKIVNREHAAGINALYQFESNIYSDTFKANDVYEKCRDILDSVFKDIDASSLFKKGKNNSLSYKISVSKSKVRFMSYLLGAERKVLLSLEDTLENKRQTRTASKMDVIYKAV